jgi:hypothetical protein
MIIRNFQGILISLILTFISCRGFSQDSDSVMIRKIFDQELLHGQCYRNLNELCSRIGPRLTGSPQAGKAVIWAKELMESYGFDSVYLQPVMVPRWIRGESEKAYILSDGKPNLLNVTALGNSIGTGIGGIRAKLAEVQSLEELDSLGVEKILGRIVFFNGRMDPTLISAGQAYGKAGVQRNRGPAKAARFGAKGVIVRSMTNLVDDYPHTGATAYEDGVPRIPAIAISTLDAGELSRELKRDPGLDFYFETHCQMLEDVLSYNVIGEIRGHEFPGEIIAVGGHLDSWDLAQGAHDDGAGCMQAIEVLRLLKDIGYRSKRTLRAVMFMNEENGLRGGLKYAQNALEKNEIHIAAIESDNGGFTPKGFGIDAADEKIEKIRGWAPLFKSYLIYDIAKGGGGADIRPLKNAGVPVIGLRVDEHRYFKYHHSALDTFDAVDQRELELGAAAMTALVYLLDQHGL